MRMLKIAVGFLVHKVRAFLHPKATLLREKQPAPDFDLPDETGKQHRLRDYLGKKIVLWFFLRASTPG
jgi:AhpC/TSA family